MSKEQLIQLRKEIKLLKNDLKGEDALISNYNYRVSYLKFSTTPIALAQDQLNLGAAYMRATILENQIQEKELQLSQLTI